MANAIRCYDKCCIAKPQRLNNFALLDYLCRVFAEFYFRCPCSVSEPLAAKQSNNPAITIDNDIISAILTTPFTKKI